jgi:hypothetical protein
MKSANHYAASQRRRFASDTLDMLELEVAMSDPRRDLIRLLGKTDSNV